MISNSFMRGACVSVLATSLVACATAERRFALREPLSRDTDLRSISIDCEHRGTPKDPRHVACAPRPYVSPLAWDGIDNTVFRPLADLFAVDPPRQAVNVDSLDEVVDSAWFTNRLGHRHPSREELLLGACSEGQLLHPEAAAPGSWVIDHGKDNGASLGFRVRVGASQKYMLKNDDPEQQERATAASAIGAAIYHAVGFNTSCEQVVYFDRNLLKLTAGLTISGNTGGSKPFDTKLLEHVLSEADRRDDLYRMQASAWLPGYLIGPFRYEGTRDDDPNDAIPHEDRRELRGVRVLAAWLNHFDSREQNSMDAWIASDPAQPDSSPGFVRHYYLDLSDCFGSVWDWDGISRRLGRSYLLDFGDIGADFITLGIPRRPWERVRREPGFEPFGYFSAREFEPDGWKNEYPNPAFSRATEADNAWMARILSRFDRADIDALVTLGKFTKPEHAAYLADVLERRLQLILERYLFVLSPLADLHVEQGDRLCATDLARRRGVRARGAFRYTAEWSASGRRQLQPVAVAEGGSICVSLPRIGVADEVAPDAAARYVVVSIANGASRYPLRAHLYDLGPRAGYRLVGIERPSAP
jgi:hypothetical protein